jgi:NAD(P)-dependent dehydrogenase (short-subunit alcohol dehydrogenase family)
MGAHEQWTTKDIPDLVGIDAIVTGANSGLGFETTRGLAAKGARVVMACRSLERGAAAAAAINREFSDASLEVMQLDLANLSSVCDFAKTYTNQRRSLHILCNNAGVMAIPKRKTADGFEMQFGTNHLGHFALTGQLVDTILATNEARVVTLSSTAHTIGKINFDDLNWEDSYGSWAAYGQSKLANLLFAYELQRRFAASGAGAISVAAHPGYAATNLQHVGPEMSGSTLWARVLRVSNRVFAQSAEMGALPTLYAVTALDVEGGDYIGPDGFMGQRGYPKKARSSAASYDQVNAKRLWDVSEVLTGVRYDGLSR